MDNEACGAASTKVPKFVAPSDPAAQWTGAQQIASESNQTVEGLAGASMRAAAGLGRFSSVTTTPALDQSIRQRAMEIGVATQLVNVRTPQEDAAALMGDGEAVFQALERLAREAIAQDGIRSVVIGGGPLALVARALAQRVDIPVLEPIPVAIRSLIKDVRDMTGPA